MIRPAFHRRDVLVALAFGLGITIGLCAWLNAVTQPETIDDYLWLARVLAPGIRSGEWTLRTLYPVIGNPWSIRIGGVVAYTILVGMWTLVSLAAIILVRLTASLLRARSSKPASSL